MDAVPPPDLDRLLADTGFVRRIARALVRDPDVADDLAQDALVVALERPPREGTSLRGWIATVVRTLAIDRARKAGARQRNEARVHARDPVPRPDEIVARLDSSRHVAEALRELEEPYRTALYLRYVEELDPGAVAEKLGVPLATAKTRLRGGLEMLRKRFDREWGGREAWSALLVPVAAHPAPAGIGAGGMLLSTSVKLVAAACLCGAAVWWLWPRAHAVPLASPGPTVASAGELIEDPTRGSQADESRVQAATKSDANGENVRDPVATGPFVRVLDERRFPVAGAHVSLHIEGFGDDRAASDAHGIARFTGLPHIEDEDRTASLLAWDDRGLAGVTSCAIRRIEAGATTDVEASALRSLGEIVMSPGGSLSVRVNSAGRAAVGAHVSIEARAARMPVLEADADADGRVFCEHFPSVPVVVRAELGAHAGRATAVVARAKATDLVVILELERSVDVHVADVDTHAPVVGARLRVSESFMITSDEPRWGESGRTYGASKRLSLSVPPTDASGMTRIVGLPAQGSYSVWATAEGYGMPLPPRGAFAIGESSSVTVEMNSLHPRTVRWPLEKGEVEPPPAGTSLELRDRNPERWIHDYDSVPPKRARIEDGAIVADGVLDRMDSAIAVAPDGALALLQVGDEAKTGLVTSFRSPRRLDVKVLDADGGPAPRITVALSDDGSHALKPDEKTDSEGVTSFTSLWDRHVYVSVAGRSAGNVDLERGDGHFESRLPRRDDGGRSYAIRLLLDGTPGLPPIYQLSGGPFYRVVSEEPAFGILHLQVEAASDSKPRQLAIFAPGFSPATANLDDDSSGATHVVDVELHRSSSLLALVAAPRSAGVRLRAEVWDSARGAWSMGSVHRVDDERYSPNAPDGGYSFEDLKPGRYRVHDLRSDRASEGIDVAAGKHGEVSLDLSDIVRVHGVIEMPPDSSPWYAHVLVEGEGLEASEPRAARGDEPPAGHYMLDKDGHFEVFVSATHPTTLRAAHPFLSPDPKWGTAVVQGEADDVHLKLIAGDEVQIALEPPNNGGQRNHLRVYAYSGEPVGEPNAWFYALAKDDVAHFSGLEHGTWSLWIDPDPRKAPVVLRGVQVGDGVTRVAAQTSQGSSLRVRIVNFSGTAAPHIWVNAKHVGEPMHFRGTVSEGENPVVATGFGRGLYTVSVSINYGPTRLERSIEFDGTTDVDMEFDASASGGK